MVNFPHHRPGDKHISAAEWNRLVDAINGLTKLTVYPPLTMITTPGGIAIGVDLADDEWLAHLTTGASAATGTPPTLTPSTDGVATILSFDGTSTAAARTGVALLNPYKTAAAAGKICTIKKKWGVLWLHTFDC